MVITHRNGIKLQVELIHVFVDLIRIQRLKKRYQVYQEHIKKFPEAELLYLLLPQEHQFQKDAMSNTMRFKIKKVIKNDDQCSLRAGDIVQYLESTLIIDQ